MDSTSQFIANDYDLIRDKSSFQIITGPNMVTAFVKRSFYFSVVRVFVLFCFCLFIYLFIFFNICLFME